MTEKSSVGLSRRDFLKLLAATGIVAGGGYVLSEYTSWRPGPPDMSLK